MLREFAPAKINLFLHAGEKRPDGYHELESLVVFADVGDELTLQESDQFRLDIEGPFARALAKDETNLVTRAAHVFAKFAQVEPRVSITLTKNLPIASGIGGGSSDAAATMRGLCRLFPGRLGLTQLWDIGNELGADVPVSVMPGCWWMMGRGERFATVNQVGTVDVVLVNAGAAVSTADVFGRLCERRGVGRMPKPPADSGTVTTLANYLKAAGNDLEAPAKGLCAVIADELDALTRQDALLARMSGSGATCFGLFPDEVRARMAAEAIAREHPNWWVVATKLNRGRKWEFQ
jgi:4-diphosphocytidyl-2-C-methyl-D-erythritol kinase